MNLWQCRAEDLRRGMTLPSGQSVVNSIVTMGIFDGVHLGHQQLLESTLDSARELHLPALVITFDPHPAILLSPAQRPKLLMTLSQRLEMFKEHGAESVWVIPFSRDFSELSAPAFLRQLEDALAPRELHVGRAFRFGKDRKGDLATLEAWGRSSGCRVFGHTFRAFDGGRLSSTRIRHELDAGNVDEAARLLGRPFELSGIVVDGERRGRHLGFPTANLAWEQEQLPAGGVYVTRVSSNHLQLPRVGLTNIGFKPTFGGPAITVETHLPHFSGDLYGGHLSLQFLHRLRGEKQFSGMEALREQIARDVEAGCVWMETHALKGIS